MTVSNLVLKKSINIHPKIGLLKLIDCFKFILIATYENTIAMAEGEELQVIEMDQGDGWTKVRRITDVDCVEGFVPTNYIDCTELE